MQTIDVATRHTVVNVAVPASTADAVTTITLPNGWLESVIVLWPPGANALVGMRLVYNGAQIVPWPLSAAATFAVGSGERLVLPVDMYTPAPIQVHNTNTDLLTHTIYQTFVWHTYDPTTLPAVIPTVVA
jgi:hypothetical protein